LLKTFSINPFQGQYPNMAVRITTTPTNPRTHRKTPEMKKAKIINITPMIDRKTPSPLPTFFTFMVGFSSLNSSCYDIHRRNQNKNLKKTLRAMEPHGESPWYLHDIPSYAKASEGYPPAAKSVGASVLQRRNDLYTDNAFIYGQSP
jgi:hypothetical protein